VADQRELGVFYDVHDYAGILRRLAIVVVDFVILVLAYLLMAVVAAFSDFVNQHMLVLYLALCYPYLAVLKTTRWGTVGYLVTGVRLVDLRGNRVRLWRATFRFLFLVFGPLNLLFDIIWLGGDPNRQSIRDKFAATYVIRKRAAPAGQGAIRYMTFFMGGSTLMFQEVERRVTEPADPGDP
jgi:uncharacterized RDD family membrane protein YckC